MGRFWIVRIAVFVTTVVLVLFWTACGAPSGIGTCSIHAHVAPMAGVADHTLAPPGNQVQFYPAYSPDKGCDPPPMPISGTWITTDPANTYIDPNTGLATCLNTTPTAAQIQFTKTTYGWSYDFATLTCK